uniref:Uncharacterized protein n=1 Tax=Avena sativa TaxID=4498 RepID=A0ACD5U0W6_AVESA
MAAAANPSYLQTGLVLQALHQKEYLLHLYLYQQLESSPNANQKIVVNPGLPFGFGLTVANDWAIYDGILPNGKLVARALGMHIGAGKADYNWYFSFNMMFVDDRFKGSVLNVNGLNGINPGVGGQWAIVGGNGEFAHAQGTITYTDKAVSGGVMKELRIRVLCPDNPTPTLVTSPIKVEPPVGGSVGKAVDIIGKPQRLRSGYVIDSISFSYTDEAGVKQTAGPWGGGNGGHPVKINFKPTETVKKIMGTTGNFGGNVVVNSLKIVTNLDTYGPYGKENGAQFSIPDKDTDSVVCFHGPDGLFLDAIGIYVTKSYFLLSAI